MKKHKVKTMAAFIKSNENRLFSVLPTHSYALYEPEDQGRAEAEYAVKRIFRKVYNADITDFSTLLITAQHEEEVDAVIGLRNAGQTQLFLESYLPKPIEKLLEQDYGMNISRDSFIEIGNLVATRAGSSRQLFIMLAFALYEAGIEWVTFTATKQVELLLGKLAFQPIVIGKAQHEAVVNGESSWGTYYIDTATVCIGNVKQAIETLKQDPTVNAIYSTIRPMVKELAARISTGFKR
jgi:hypothetical protein